MRSTIERNTNRIALGNRQGRVIVSAVETARMLDCVHRFARHLVRHAMVVVCSSMAKRLSKQAAATGAAGYLGRPSLSTSRSRSWQTAFPLPLASVVRVQLES
jgi:hypothetical protein